MKLDYETSYRAQRKLNRTRAGLQEKDKGTTVQEKILVEMITKLEQRSQLIQPDIHNSSYNNVKTAFYIDQFKNKFVLQLTISFRQQRYHLISNDSQFREQSKILEQLNFFLLKIPIVNQSQKYILEISLFNQYMNFYNVYRVIENSQCMINYSQFILYVNKKFTQFIHSNTLTIKISITNNNYKKLNDILTANSVQFQINHVYINYKLNIYFAHSQKNQQQFRLQLYKKSIFSKILKTLNIIKEASKLKELSQSIKYFYSNQQIKLCIRLNNKRMTKIKQIKKHKKNYEELEFDCYKISINYLRFKLESKQDID